MSTSSDVQTFFIFFYFSFFFFVIRVYESSSVRRTVIFSVIIALYAVTLPYCYHTAGEPRAAAMLHAQKLGKYLQYRVV